MKTRMISIATGVVFLLSGSLSMAEKEPELPPVNAKIVAFIAANIGNKIGEGNCWNLANRSLKESGAKRPGKNNYVWGREIDPDKEDVLPGDIIQLFEKENEPHGKHTAVIYKVLNKNEVIIAEQNFNKKLFVTTRKMDFRKAVKARDLHIYRPS